jgi:hypothetical protein
MRTSLIIASLTLYCCVNSMNAQDTITKEMIYKTSVKLISDPHFNCYGALYEVHDSSISILSHRVKDYYSGNLELTKLPVEDFKFILTPAPGSGRRGAWREADFGAALRVLIEELSE